MTQVRRWTIAVPPEENVKTLTEAAELAEKLSRTRRPNAVEGPFATGGFERVEVRDRAGKVVGGAGRMVVP